MTLTCILYHFINDHLCIEWQASAVAFSAKHGGIFSEDITSPAVALSASLQDSRGHGRWHGTLPGFGLFPHWGPGVFMTCTFHGRKHIPIRFDTTRFGLSILNRISWLVVWNHAILWLSIYWEFHHPNWRTHIFPRGRSTTNQICFDTPCFGQSQGTSFRMARSSQLLA